jgi:polysaccharide biosynthesis/export protein
MAIKGPLKAFTTQSLVGVLAIFLNSCSGTPHTEPMQAIVNVPQPVYAVQPGDVLDVKFLYSPELNEEQTVQLDGHMSLQLAPDLMVQGKTVDQVRLIVVDAYGKTLRDPSAEVAIKGPLQWKVYVVGEVTTPGEYISAGPPLTLTQAVARAGGLKESADPDKVVLLRRDGNIERAFALNYKQAVNHDSPIADVKLAASDVVYVPRTGVADAGVVWRQYVMQFLPPNVSFVVGSSSSFIP